MAKAVWLYYIAKLTELLDTVFFVLRKKDRQISFLHMYHHTLMPICAFIGLKYFAGKLKLRCVEEIAYENNNKSCRWPWNSSRLHQLFHPYRHVCLLLASCHGTKNPEVPLVEEIHYSPPNCKLILSICPYKQICFSFRSNSWSSLFTLYNSNFNQVVTSQNQSLAF